MLDDTVDLMVLDIMMPKMDGYEFVHQAKMTGGSGLGLYIAKTLANQIDSEIEVKSKLNVGSVFSLIITKK